ncbi:MAG: SCP2 sterol-binding domain-containing protein [Polyangiales bacterium]
MPVTPIEFLTDKFPALYERGVAVLRARADAGDARAKMHLDDVVGASGTGFVTIAGQGTVWLTVGNGTMKSSAERPAGLPVRLAVELPADAAEQLLALAESKNALEDEKAAIAAARTSSKRFEDALAGRKMSCHFTVRDVPRLDDVTAKVAMNSDTLPEKPGFTGELEYDDLIALTQKKIQPQQLMMGGKLKLKGDYSIAMQVGMQLIAQASKR